MSKNVLHDGQDASHNAKPTYFDTAQVAPPLVAFDKRVVWPSKMFTIKLELDVFTAESPDIPVYDASQGDGGASLGGIPRDELAEALIRYLPETCTTKYGTPTGRADVRAAIHDNYYGFEPEAGLSPDNIVLVDGGRDGLQKWYQLIVQDTGGIGGSILVTAAPWGSYPQGTYVNCLNVMRAPGDASEGFRLTPGSVDVCLEKAQRDRRPIVGMIITSPDNPTGGYTPTEEIVALIEHATERGIPHIFVDVVYQAVTDADVGLYDVNAMFKTLTADARQRVVFMDSLTKAAGASNIRSGHLVVGSDEYVTRLKGIATHTVLPNAMGEAAALEVYGADSPLEHPWVARVVGPTAESRRVVQRKLAELDFRFIADQGYYAFINIWPWLGRRFPAGKHVVGTAGEVIETVDSVATLKSYLTTRCGLAVIHGSVFNQPDFIRFSYANTPTYTAAAIDRLHESLSMLAP